MVKKVGALIAAVLLASSTTITAGTANYDTTTYKVTAYCDCQKCCGKTDGITATGTRAKEGRTIAVDPKQIPYGSTVLIYYKNELQGIYIAEDCGGAIKGNRIDLFFEDHSRALEWGVKDCEIVILDGKG